LLPDFCGLPAVFAVVVGAELLAIALALGSGLPWQDSWHRLSLLSLYLQWIGLSAALLLCLLRAPLARLPARRAASLAWGLWLLVAAAVSLVAGELAERLGLGLDPDGRLGLLLKTLAIAAIAGALVLRYLYLQHLRRRQFEAESQARVQALQARIRPHFLFNSLNTIAELTRSDPVLAEELIQDLADLFRVSLGEGGSTSLERELELARRYLHLEQQRLGERLRVEWDLQDLPLEARLPPLVLQPLLENAVYHGVEPALEPGPVHIAGRYRKHQVSFSIRNQVPAAAGGEHRQGNRMALDNIRQRLEAHFPGQASLVASRVEDDYQIRLAFPHPWFEPDGD
jgi:two-component system sensor histidine kinase AlgZ